MCYSLSINAVSAFFAQVIGFYLIFMCLAMLLRPQAFKKVMTDLMSHQASLFICATLNIIFGLVILVPHNIWVAGWPVLVTIIGWLTLLKGAFSFFVGDKYFNVVKKLLDKSGYQIWCWIWLLIAIYLVWMGLAQNI